MSTDSSPRAVPAGDRSLARLTADDGVWVGIASVDEASGAPGGLGAGRATLTDSSWCRWWRDLIVERHRTDRFDSFVPLPASGCAWEVRVGVGRVVEHAMAEACGPALSTQLVIEALDAAGFGRVRDLTPDARRVALRRSGWWSDPWPGDDDLRLGVLGTIADALLQEIPPTSAELDLRDREASTIESVPVVAETVRRATRTAVLAYARHVEHLAVRSRAAARSLQF